MGWKKINAKISNNIEVHKYRALRDPLIQFQFFCKVFVKSSHWGNVFASFTSQLSTVVKQNSNRNCVWLIQIYFLMLCFLVYFLYEYFLLITAGYRSTLCKLNHNAFSILENHYPSSFLTTKPRKFKYFGDPYIYLKLKLKRLAINNYILLKQNSSTYYCLRLISITIGQQVIFNIYY